MSNEEAAALIDAVDECMARLTRLADHLPAEDFAAWDLFGRLDDGLLQIYCDLVHAYENREAASK